MNVCSYQETSVVSESDKGKVDAPRRLEASSESYFSTRRIR